MMFANDAAFVSTSEEKIQLIVTAFVQFCTDFEFIISIFKTEKLIQQSSKTKKEYAIVGKTNICSKL